MQGATFPMQAWAVVFNLPSAAQDDFWAQGEVFHQHAPVIQHFTLALAAHLSTCAKRRQRDLVSMLSRALLDLRCHHLGRTGTMSTHQTATSVLEHTCWGLNEFLRQLPAFNGPCKIASLWIQYTDLEKRDSWKIRRILFWISCYRRCFWGTAENAQWICSSVAISSLYAHGAPFPL